MAPLFADLLYLIFSPLPCHAGRYAYRVIKAAIKESKAVGADETGMNESGGLGWFWAWQSKVATYEMPPSDPSKSLKFFHFISATFTPPCTSHNQRNAQPP